ncbi:MAG: hypothetical protein CMQ45_06395 [Gammaproteobacteria bacterium]|nr:hypothetical protein [Gammaproteobacteria bacterium]
MFRLVALYLFLFSLMLPTVSGAATWALLDMSEHGEPAVMIGSGYHALASDANQHSDRTDKSVSTSHQHETQDDRHNDQDCDSECFSCANQCFSPALLGHLCERSSKNRAYAPLQFHPLARFINQPLRPPICV